MRRRSLPFHLLSSRHQRRLINAALEADDENREEPDEFPVNEELEMLYESDGAEDQGEEVNAVHDLNVVPMEVPSLDIEEVLLNTAGQMSPEVSEQNSSQMTDTNDSEASSQFSDLSSHSDWDSEEEESEEEIFINKLAEFCLVHLPDYATDNLLKLLGETKKFDKLPKRHEELFGDIKDLPKPVAVGGGHMLHLGVRLNLLSLPVEEVPAVLEAEFSYDGVQLHKSSKKTMWPIVMALPSLPDVGVRLISVFVGQKKYLTVKEFLFCLTEELKEIFEGGSQVEVGPKRLKTCFKVSKVVADNPAKTFGLGNV